MRIIAHSGRIQESERVKLLSSGESTVQGMLQQGGDVRRSVHWDLEATARNSSWIRGAITTIAKNLVGPGWRFVKVKEFEDEATEEALARLKKFYGVAKKDYGNWKSFYTTSGKFYATAVHIALGNFAVWEIVKDKLLGQPAGFDYVPGFVEPRFKPDGTFKTPAFVQYLSSTGLQYVEWDDPNDIVFFARPDFGGLPFASDLEALVQYTLPADIYAALSWLSMHKNRTAPLDGWWEASPEMPEEQYEKFERLLLKKYSGGAAYAKAPILAKGGIKFMPMKRASEEAPFIEGRNLARREIGAVTGVHDSKLGLEPATRDSKRDFYETTIEPLQQIIEDSSYEQVHCRLLNIRGWKLQFNNPAFVNELEQASIDRTMWNIGARNANEIRERDGLPPRADGKGDVYYEPANMIPVGGKQVDVPAQGDNPGTSPDTLPPSEGDPVGQKPRPPRADEQAMQDELRKWETVAVKRAKAGKQPKEFECLFLNEEIANGIRRGLKIAETVDDIKFVFDVAGERISDAEE